VTPYYADGDLTYNIEEAKRENQFIEKDVVLRVAYELACGLKIIHEKKIIHRDIKPHSIYLFLKEPAWVIGLFHLFNDNLL
jgi:serine/threonine protein kinase